MPAKANPGALAGATGALVSAERRAGRSEHSLRPAQGNSHRESDERYFGIVARLNERWRVIRCPDGIQWILQRRERVSGPDGARWEGRSYCTTRDGLRLSIRAQIRLCDGEALQAVACLPARISRTLPDVGGRSDG